MRLVREQGPTTRGTSGALVVEALSVRYGGVAAVRDVSLCVPTSSAVGLIGANGAGKSSTLKAILGLVRRSATAITYGDVNLLEVPPWQVPRVGIGYVPEGRHVFGDLSVRKNLLLGAYSQRWGMRVDARMEKVFENFPVLADMSERPAGALSGGQQQMLAIGRALMGDPGLLILDEPSMGLSPLLVDEVLEVIRTVKAAGVGVLLVEQNAKITFEATDECYVMENGRIAMKGMSDALRSDPGVRKVYLGI